MTRPHTFTESVIIGTQTGHRKCTLKQTERQLFTWNTGETLNVIKMQLQPAGRPALPSEPTVRNIPIPTTTLTICTKGPCKQTLCRVCEWQNPAKNTHIRTHKTSGVVGCFIASASDNSAHRGHTMVAPPEEISFVAASKFVGGILLNGERKMLSSFYLFPLPSSLQVMGMLALRP